jgi:hypothetical protein
MGSKSNIHEPLFIAYIMPGRGSETKFIRAEVKYDLFRPFGTQYWRRIKPNSIVLPADNQCSQEAQKYNKLVIQMESIDNTKLGVHSEKLIKELDQTLLNIQAKAIPLCEL